MGITLRRPGISKTAHTSGCLLCVRFVCPDDLFVQIVNPPGNKVNSSFALWRCILLGKQLPWTFLPSKEGKGLPLGVQQTQVVLGEGSACLQAENQEPEG